MLGAATRGAARRFVDTGAQVSEQSFPEPLDTVLERHGVVMAVECAAHHAERFATRADDYRPKVRRLIEYGLGLAATTYAEALRHQRGFQARALDCFGDCQALLTPAATSTAPRDLGTTGMPTLNSPWSYAGLPTLVVPTGVAADGLPVGIQLVGRPDREAELFAIAAWCEANLVFDFRPRLLEAA